MPGMSDKDQSREKRDVIRQILMSEWDPIGVNDTPEAADEYDGYVGPVLDLLTAGASSERVAKYLQDVEIERMGLTDAQGKPLLSTKQRNAAVDSLMLLMPQGLLPKKAPKSKGFRHWKLFTKNTSPAFTKTQRRREHGVCIACGADPCRCKNPRG
jgi:hypothetical protein